MDKWYEYKFQNVGCGECKNIDTIRISRHGIFQTLKEFKAFLKGNKNIAWFGEFKEI